MPSLSLNPTSRLTYLSCTLILLSLNNSSHPPPLVSFVLTSTFTHLSYYSDFAPSRLTYLTTSYPTITLIKLSTLSTFLSTSMKCYLLSVCLSLFDLPLLFIKSKLYFFLISYISIFYIKIFFNFSIYIIYHWYTIAYILPRIDNKYIHDIH